MAKEKNEAGKAKVRKLWMQVAMYLCLSLVCIILANGVLAETVWHDALLIISGVLMGVFAVYLTMVNIARKELAVRSKGSGYGRVK